MTHVMTPSDETITASQIGELQELLAARLRESNLRSEPVQQVIETQGDALVVDLVSAIQKRVEMISKVIVRRVKVNRTRAPREALDATGRRLYVNDNVAKAMPRGEGDEVDVHFFKLDRYVSDDELEDEYVLRGLRAADPYSLAAANEVDSTFADEHPNCTHWKDANGKWCYAAFDRWRDERHVYVDRYDRDWDDGWWFAGVRK